MPEVADYCRQLETYLCQKNGGHLVRIVGPAFDRVRDWAESGIPLTVAQRGIDRYCERAAGKQKARTRPVRIEFCEADILDVFDEWRRAVGVSLASHGVDAPPEPARKPPLAAHFERVVARLVARRAPSSPAFERHLESLLLELDRLAADSRHARGDLRAGIVERLAALDRELMQAAAVEVDGRVATAARDEAENEIAPFASRMDPEVKAAALQAAYERLIRESLGLPIVRYG